MPITTMNKESVESEFYNFIIYFSSDDIERDFLQKSSEKYIESLTLPKGKLTKQTLTRMIIKWIKTDKSIPKKWIDDMNRSLKGYMKEAYNNG